MIPTTGHFGRGKTVETIKRLPGCLRGRRTRWIGEAQRVFRAVKTLCMIWWWYTHRCAFGETRGMCNQGLPLTKVTYGLWASWCAILGSSWVKKNTIWGSDIDNGRGYECVRAGSIQGGTQKTWNLYIKYRAFILTRLNFAHLQSTLHLTQYTYRDIFSTAQHSFWTHWFWCLLVFLPFFVSPFPHQVAQERSGE